MRTNARLVWLYAVIPCLWLWAAACTTVEPPPPAGSAWEREMRSGAEAVQAGEADEAQSAYTRALRAAIEPPGDPNQVAFAAWHLGDVCFRTPVVCPLGEAQRRTEESLAVFAALYGPEHPVVIPILLRLSELRAGEGDRTGAADLLERADRITARTFPESHFMRMQKGAHRPAADLDPRELLQILTEVDLLGG